MKIKCLFLDLPHSCPYEEGGYCDDIEINSGNGDAWCRKNIERQLNDKYCEYWDLEEGKCYK